MAHYDGHTERSVSPSEKLKREFRKATTTQPAAPPVTAPPRTAAPAAVRPPAPLPVPVPQAPPLGVAPTTRHTGPMRLGFGTHVRGSTTARQSTMSNFGPRTGGRAGRGLMNRVMNPMVGLGRGLRTGPIYPPPATHTRPRAHQQPNFADFHGGRFRGPFSPSRGPYGGRIPAHLLRAGAVAGAAVGSDGEEGESDEDEIEEMKMNRAKFMGSAKKDARHIVVPEGVTVVADELRRKLKQRLGRGGRAFAPGDRELLEEEFVKLRRRPYPSKKEKDRLVVRSKKLSLGQVDSYFKRKRKAVWIPYIEELKEELMRKKKKAPRKKKKPKVQASDPPVPSLPHTGDKRPSPPATPPATKRRKKGKSDDDRPGDVDDKGKGGHSGSQDGFSS